MGQGYIDNVEPADWNYEVSGKQILLQWFSYGKANRDHPIRQSPNDDFRLTNRLNFGIRTSTDHWLAEDTTELLNVLNVLALLIDLEPTQAKLLEKICSGPTLTAETLRTAGALEAPAEPRRKTNQNSGPDLFDGANS